MFSSYTVLPYELIYMRFLSIPKGLATYVTALLMWSLSCSGGNLRHHAARVAHHRQPLAQSILPHIYFQETSEEILLSLSIP